MNNDYVIMTCPFCEDLIEVNNDDLIMRIQTQGCDNCLDARDPSHLPDDARFRKPGSDNGTDWNTMMSSGSG